MAVIPTNSPYQKTIENTSRGDASRVFVANEYSNPVPVDVTDRGETKLEFNEVNSIGLGTIEILNLTVPIGKGCYPSFTFLVGFTMGHLFWRMESKNIWKKIKVSNETKKR
jgi:hypothetical protein